MPMTSAFFAAMLLASPNSTPREKLPETQIRSPGDHLTYRNAMRCGALNVLLSIAQEDEKNSDNVKPYDDHGTRWLVLAMLRDGNDGNTAQAEFEDITIALVDKIETFGGDDAKIDAFLSDVAAKCDDLRQKHKIEFDTVEIPEDL